MKIKYFLLLMPCIMFTACQKDFLEKKPDQAILIPTTLPDLQGLLDNYNVFNVAPYLGLIGCDDIVTTDAGWQDATPLVQLSYIWAKYPFENSVITDWNKCYEQVFYTNIVLTQIEKITPSNLKEWNRIKGIALFYRALANYNLAQLFAAPYQAQTADTEMGIPVRLTPDITMMSGRGTLNETYTQVLNDLLQAKDLLVNIEITKARPTKPAALALLARVYQTMGNYKQALVYANESLTISSKLIDYNTLTPSSARPFPSIFSGVNDEVLHYTPLTGTSFLTTSTQTTIDPILLSSYQTNDLRKTVFFTSIGVFKGGYSGSTTVFAGLATDEVYLIKAECLARAGLVGDAMDVLNLLLINRWKKNTFKPFEADTKKQALDIIFLERRKELVYRNLRWTDLRRLNLETDFAVNIKRIIGGITYTLPANDKRYVYPIPDDEALLNNLPQNQR